MSALSTHNATRGQIPRLPLASIAAAVLPGWEISVAFVSPGRALSLNRKLRGKDYTPNVLSYRAGAGNGEIIICPARARGEAATYGHGAAEHIFFLFIHGILHLKGCRHSATMERRERTLLKKWSATASTPTHVPTHRHRH